MKSIILIALLSVSASLMHKGPDITFDQQVLDLDTLHIEVYNGAFAFTNTGDEPLLIYKAYAAAGNVVTSWDREPIVPGAVGKIEFIMDTRSRQGSFNTIITVEANTEQKRYILTIKGYIQPKDEE